MKRSRLARKPRGKSILIDIVNGYWVAKKGGKLVGMEKVNPRSSRFSRRLQRKINIVLTPTQLMYGGWLSKTKKVEDYQRQFW